MLFFGTLHLVGCTFPFLPCFSLLFFLQLFVKPSQIITLPSCFSFSLGWYCSLLPIQYYRPLSIVLQAQFTGSNPLNPFVTSLQICRFIPIYIFIIFDVMVNGIFSVIFLSELSFLLYKNATDFCLLILHPASLLNSLMSSSSFLAACLGFSMYLSCHLQTVTVLLLLSQVGFLLFPFLLRLPRLGLPKLCCENGHPCLVPNFRRNAFSFCPLTMILALALSYMDFIMLRCFLYAHFLKNFYHK